MNIWDFLVMLIPVLQLGASIKEFNQEKNGEKKSASLVAGLIVFLVWMFLFYKTGIIKL